jgi:dephospho-CoA kinase
VSADEAARRAVEDSEIKAMLCAAFGDVLKPDGSLDRRLVAQIAFSSPQNTATLNAITHPKIAELMLEEAQQCDGDTVIFDASQLFEAGEDVYCSRIVGVLANEGLRAERIMSRDGITLDEAQLRMSAQLSEKFFIDRCDDIIYNNGTEQALCAQVRKLFERLVSE